MDLKGILERVVFNGKADRLIFDELKKSSKPVLIYGGSEYAGSVYDYLKRNDIEAEFFIVDSRYWKENKYIKGKEVKSIEKCEIEDYNIVIGFGDVTKSKFLINNSQLLRSTFYMLWEPIKFYEWDTEYVKENWELLMDVYNGLADRKSKHVLTELIVAKLNGCCVDLLNVSSGKHYFNELTFCPNPEKEVFIDCGAYNGDTILQFAAFTDKNYRKIYAFEPISENISELKKNVKCLTNVEIINKGTWKEDDNLSFEKKDDGSHIVQDNGKDTVQVTAIDNVIKDECVTFIKMDIEGSELESLQGASRVIQRDMPKLAICCYHKKNDIIDLYNYIRKFENYNYKYNIYLRHHSNGTCETVLYAIPVKKTL